MLLHYLSAACTPVRRGGAGQKRSAFNAVHYLHYLHYLSCTRT
jgi:hypothetical protein